MWKDEIDECHIREKQEESIMQSFICYEPKTVLAINY